MHVWQRTPFLKVFIAFACGILCADALRFESSWMYSCIALLCIALPALCFRWSFKLRFLLGFIFCAGWMLCGICLTQWHQPQYQPLHYSHWVADADTALALVEVQSTPKMKEYGASVHTECKVLLRGADSTRCFGKLNVFVKHEMLPQGLLPGDAMWIRLRFQPLAAASNPGAFDYRRYAERKGITHQGRCVQVNAVFRAGQQWRGVRAQCLVWREELLARMQMHVHDTAVFHLLSALVLGKTDDMEEDVLATYSKAGVVHILAVSGLHVGLIYAMLQPLCKRLFAKRKGKWVKTLVPMGLLWMFAGITGFSPSVLRAAVMFSFFIVTENFPKKGNPLNTLFASAVVLLAVDPCMLFDVGFQLSYLAVIGIVMLQKRLANAIVFKNRWLALGWQMMAVSIAAQLTTLPVTLACFHQFPMYFLFTNAVAIPLSTALLYVALALLAFSWLPVPAALLANVCESLTRIMNTGVAWFSALPGSVWERIYLNAFDVLVLSLLVLFTTLGIYMWSMRWCKAALWVCMAWSAVALFRLCAHTPTALVCVHSTQQGVAVSVVQDRHCTLLADSVFLMNEKNARYIIEPLCAAYNIDCVDTVHIRLGARWHWKGKAWQWLAANGSAKDSTDVLLLSAPERGTKRKWMDAPTGAEMVVSVGRWSERQMERMPWDNLAPIIYHSGQGAMVLSP